MGTTFASFQALGKACCLIYMLKMSHNGTQSSGKSLINLDGQPSGPQELEFFKAKAAFLNSLGLNKGISLRVALQRAKSGML